MIPFKIIAAGKQRFYRSREWPPDVFLFCPGIALHKLYRGIVMVRDILLAIGALLAAPVGTVLLLWLIGLVAADKNYDKEKCRLHR